MFSRPTILLQLYGFRRRQNTPFRVQGSRLNPSRKTPTILGKKQSVILTSPGSLGGGVLRPREMAAVRGQRQTSRDCLPFQADKENPSPRKASSAGFDVPLPSGAASDKRGRRGQGAENKEAFPGLLITPLLCK